MNGDGPADGDDGTRAGDGPADGDDGTGRSARWRCAWCGKPQDRNDPPCGNCGHHKFERAVVPVAPETDDYERDPIWVCPECGRQHQKNSPPCSRCGNPALDRRIPGEEDFAEELGTTSYLDLVEPPFVLGLAVAVLAAAGLVLAMLGVITLPGMDGGGNLTVDGVPGAAETANGVDLAEVEADYLAAVNERRTAAGRPSLERDDRLDEVATFATQRRVKSRHGDAQTPSSDRLGAAIDDACRTERVPYVRLDAPSGDAASDSASALADVLVDEAFDRDPSPADVEGSTTGLDVHVGPDGRVFLSQFVC
jgi:hypothetical protein